MLLCKRMITGFNTDVPHEGQVYHVQTEDRGQDHPVLESLVYIGGTIIAKKMTPYADQLGQGADEQMIAGLLKRQHQIIIAAIKAGRVEELVQRYAGQPRAVEKPEPPVSKDEAAESKPSRPKRSSGEYAKRSSGEYAKRNSGKLAQPNGDKLAQPNGDKLAQPNGDKLAQPNGDKLAQPNGDTIVAGSVKLPPPGNTGPTQERPSAMRTTSMLGSPRRPEPPPPKPAAPAPVHPSLDPRPTSTSARRPTGTLDLDQVINDYMKRNDEQGKLDLKVITPSIFIAGKNVGLRVQVLFNATVEPEAVVTIKIIGTAFKPQVYIGRAGRDGIANFSLSLPGFTAGTAAIVIEAQSNRGRGELKHLIRRA